MPVIIVAWFWPCECRRTAVSLHYISNEIWCGERLDMRNLLLLYEKKKYNNKNPFVRRDLRRRRKNNLYTNFFYSLSLYTRREFIVVFLNSYAASFFLFFFIRHSFSNIISFNCRLSATYAMFFLCIFYLFFCFISRCRYKIFIPGERRNEMVGRQGRGAYRGRSGCFFLLL